MSWKQMLVQMLVQVFVISLGVGAVIQFWFNKQLERLRFETRLRERAALIAELLAEWSSRPADKVRLPDHIKRLNQLNFEASIWLPAPIVRDMSRILTYAEGKKDPKDILIQVRSFLRGESDDLSPTELVHFEIPKSGPMT